MEQVYTISNLEKNYMFERMHNSALGNKDKLCTYNEAVSVMESIKTIQEQNNG